MILNCDVKEAKRLEHNAKRLAYYHANKENLNAKAKLRYKERMKDPTYKQKLYDQNKKFRLANPDITKEAALKYYHRVKHEEEHIIGHLYKRAKSRAKKSGIEFSITKDDIILPEVCPILGTPFEIGNKKTSYSLDKKDSNKGYTKDNVWVISLLANAMKWDSCHEERVQFANWVMSLEGGELP